ncbi:6-pyruvoyl trahydropterin synthase family protein [Parvularcula lutaonensis]|uniref:6-carboxy-5,6,7,8-tetrahydropterin synthase n=1 Tax=Parvularcula lutaonensis TaxID=491923 RepID=A0ABV7M7Y6_9PROT|nr:6-carboxytetrahydropterin synthase [Parvularcula lutaonensis]GGY43413.1 6-carboxy-5,6,7,8-tetrahydropterin synthase [Parvularcula lutaonensis]
MFEQRYRFHFEAAHQLGVNVDTKDHPYAHVHGHSFEVFLILRGKELGPKGWLTDFGRVRKTAEEIHDLLDHRYLNDIEGLEVPTLENIAKFIFDKASASLEKLAAVEVNRPSLGEQVRYEA